MNDVRPDGDLIAPAEFQRADPAAARTRAGVPVRAIAIAAALLVLAAVALFMFLGQPVRILITPTPTQMAVTGGPSFVLGERFLLLEGSYQVSAQLEGHHDLDASFEVVGGGEDLFEFAMRRLPGRLRVDTTPMLPDEVLVDVLIDGELAGTAPLADVDIEPGERTVSVRAARYLEAAQVIDVIGMREEVVLTFALEPAWADVFVSSRPAGAELRVDGEPMQITTPVSAEILAGERVLTLHLEGHKTVRQRLELEPSQQLTLPEFTLEKIDGLLVVSSNPSGATVTVNEQYRGRTPVAVDLRPGTSYQVDLFKAGFQPSGQRVRIDSGIETQLAVELEAVRGELRIAVTPSDARVIVDGVDRGDADQVLQLTAIEHRIEIVKDGYVPYRASVTPRPEFPQEITLALKTLEQARIEAIKPEYVATNGQTLKLIKPQPFTMGASRRQPGRRANEVLRDVVLEREFYLATTEVTNARFRAFASGHSSGKFEQYDLDGDEFPAVELTWTDAARYCNWLSEREGLPLVYRVENGEIRGFDPDAIGYRLPTEAEWAFVARVQEDGTLLRFPWGTSRAPPEDRLGNYADRAATNLLARSIPDYTDGYVTTAPIGNYAPGRYGMYDLGGNVAEWINDFYGATENELPTGITDPLGPPRGEYHVIRGSSWMHGQLVDLRLSFRDYGAGPRPDVGFRIARWVE